VKRLTRHHKINAAIGPRGIVRRTMDAEEFRESGKILLAGAAHSVVRFHSKNAIAVFQKKLRKNSGARTNVCNYMIRTKSTLITQKIDQRRRIPRTVANVIRYTV